jgi:hypothetical protein
MKDLHLETLSALFDGESVDPDILAEALADPQAPSALRQFAACRSELRQDPDRPDAEFYDSMREILRPSLFRRVVSRPLVPAALGTAVALAAGLAGFAVRPMVSPPSPEVTQGIHASSKSRGAGAVPAQPRAPRTGDEAVDSSQPATELRPADARPIGLAEWRERTAQ